MISRSRWIWGWLFALLVLASIILIIFNGSILLKAGKFMAPECQEIDYVADVAILEGTAFVSTGVVNKGIELLSSGKARSIVIVLHRVSRNFWPFAFSEDYSSSVARKLKSLGLRDSAFKIITVHIHDPITLVAAQGALKEISKDGIRSAVLISPGFHMRRSLYVYRHLAAPLDIKINPVACFDSYQLDRWWDNEYGPREFLSESLKLTYYIIRGYIPLTSLLFQKL